MAGWVHAKSFRNASLIGAERSIVSKLMLGHLILEFSRRILLEADLNLKLADVFIHCTNTCLFYVPNRHHIRAIQRQKGKQKWLLSVDRILKKHR
ncbi:UNVERIFIED_CONTAM: hypothetical protein FKN15_027021 [Acipenser sinensis]